VPPKYQSKDFLKADFWRLRGGLDVPKERWVSYPGCERGADGSLPIAWAGWNHLQQAMALAAYFLDMKDAKAGARAFAALAGRPAWSWCPGMTTSSGTTQFTLDDLRSASFGERMGPDYYEDVSGFGPRAPGAGLGRTRLSASEVPRH
jgi:hypothetical protein